MIFFPESLHIIEYKQKYIEQPNVEVSTWLLLMSMEVRLAQFRVAGGRWRSWLPATTR